MIFLVLLLGLAANSAGGVPHSSNHPEPKLPDFIKVCKRNDPNLSECIKASVEVIKPHLKEGIPELSIPVCEPLIIPEMIMNQGKGSVIIQSKYTDVKVHGPTNFQLVQVKVDLEKSKVKIKLKLPKLDVVGNYTISGKVILMPIAGNGIFQGNYSDIDATAIMIGETTEKEGKAYFTVKDFFVDFNIGHAKMHLSNLFNGDQQLGDSMNEFLNDNWKNVAEEMKPVLENTIGNLFKEYANNIYRNYPLDTLLPP